MNVTMRPEDISIVLKFPTFELVFSERQHHITLSISRVEAEFMIADLKRLIQKFDINLKEEERERKTEERKRIRNE